MKIEGGTLVALLVTATFSFALGATAVAANDTRVTPRLIGHECYGAGGDLWAMEEDDFPTQCFDIEKWDNQHER